MARSLAPFFHVVARPSFGCVPQANDLLASTKNTLLSRYSIRWHLKSLFQPYVVKEHPFMIDLLGGDTVINQCRASNNEHVSRHLAAIVRSVVSRLLCFASIRVWVLLQSQHGAPNLFLVWREAAANHEVRLA